MNLSGFNLKGYFLTHIRQLTANRLRLYPLLIDSGYCRYWQKYKITFILQLCSANIANGRFTHAHTTNYTIKSLKKLLRLVIFLVRDMKLNVLCIMSHNDIVKMWSSLESWMIWNHFWTISFHCIRTHWWIINSSDYWTGCVCGNINICFVLQMW